MDNARSQAYGRVVKALAETGKVELKPDELLIIRTAADALLFEGDAYDELAAVEDLVQQLVDAKRWTPDRARLIVDAVAACGRSAGARS